MALEALIGLDKYLNLSPLDRYKDLHNEVADHTRNFTANCDLSVPPFTDPAEKLTQFTKDESGKEIKMDFFHGTTTLGFQYQGGIVLASDSRVSTDGIGPKYVGSQSMEKILVINDLMLGTVAGGAVDCVYWGRVLTKQCYLYELRYKKRISVAAASKLLANMIYSFKGQGLDMGMMLAGWDERGPNLYILDSEGTRVSGKCFTVGSGSYYAQAVFDGEFKWNMTDQEAFELGRKAIYHATHRDAFSGGMVRIYHISKNGWKNISNDDCMTLHYNYQADKAKPKSVLVAHDIK